MKQFVFEDNSLVAYFRIIIALNEVKPTAQVLGKNIWNDICMKW